MGNLEEGISKDYTIHKAGNGVYIFVLEGDVTVDGQALNRRDGFGVWEVDSIQLKADTNTKVLLMEVPMHLA